MKDNENGKYNFSNPSISHQIERWVKKKSAGCKIKNDKKEIGPIRISAQNFSICVFLTGVLILSSYDLIDQNGFVL